MMKSSIRLFVPGTVLLLLWAVSSMTREYAEQAERVAPDRATIAVESFQPSDRRLKMEVEDLEYGLPQLMDLHPVSYRLRAFPSEPRIGFIAQEVAVSVPEVVYLSPENPEEFEERYYSINYAELVPVLVRSIQQQQAVIASLDERLNRFEMNATD